MSKLRTAAQITKTGKTAFDYHAIVGSTSRRSVSKRTTSESFILPPGKREKASATARDDRRNMTILAWMVRRHLDNVSRFTPQFRIQGDTDAVKNLNDVVAKLLAWHARRRQFDALGRHGRDEWLRMFEACKVLSGDAGGLKCAGGRLQGIEGDRICKASNCVDKNAKPPKGVTDDGLILNKDGTVKEYSVCKRDGKSMLFESLVKTEDMIFDAYWPERFDAVRGVSPLLTALSEGADILETREWLVLKSKASAFFGLAFTRTASDEMFPSQGDPATSGPATEAAAYSAQAAAAIKSRGMINLDLDPGDSVMEIESKSPNPTVVEFTRELIRSVLLALDIPFTFYDSLTASFSARIADRNEYAESCEWKQAKNIDVLYETYHWLFPTWQTADLFGFGKALSAAGLTVEDIIEGVKWVPAGKPWLDRSKEMSGHILSLAAGVTSVPRICASYGEDAYKIAAEQKEYLENAGIPLLYAQGGQVAVQSLFDSIVRKEGQDGGTETD